MMAPGILRLAAIFSAVVTVDGFTALSASCKVVTPPRLCSHRCAALACNINVNATAAAVRTRANLYRDEAARLLSIEPPWVDTAFGCILFVWLNSLAKYATILTTPSPETDIAAARIIALLVFVMVQNAIGLPASEWLRLRADPEKVDPNPFFNSGSPIAGVTFAFIFAVPVATLAQLSGIAWLPSAVDFPGPERALLTLLVAPVSEEIFFRAWLISQFEASAAASGADRDAAQVAALISSAALFGLYHVPVGAVLNAPNGSLRLLLYEALGAYLAFLYQRSGGSLPLVAIAHCTCTLIVATLAAAQVGSTLPFV